MSVLATVKGSSEKSATSVRGLVRGYAWTLLALVIGISTACAGGELPKWVAQHGVSTKYPRDLFLTGFGVGSGEAGTAEAKQQAAADLARKIRVHIESEVSDAARDQDGVYTYKITAITSVTTDIQLSNLNYEQPYRQDGETYVLAWIERASAARSRANERDRAIAELRACLTAADAAKQAKRMPAALRTYQSCRLPVAAALQHDAVAAVLVPSPPRDRAPFEELVAASRRIDREVESIRQGPSASLSTATDAMALQLAQQGVATSGRIVVSHFDYGSTNLSSSFGRQAGLELEHALARAAKHHQAPEIDIAVRGFYLEEGDTIRLSAVAHEVSTGRPIGSAESSLPRAAIPAQLELTPANFREALLSQRVLQDGEFVSGDLQLEVFTNKGRGGVLYTDSEELKIFMRVNQPAWIRLIYVLTNGAKMPLDQGYFIDAGKVNRVVEYPQSFTIQPPFGIEMLHATAFTEKPPALATRLVEIAGHDYEVIAGGLDAVVRTRGLARKRKQQIAEDIVTVTTTPRF